MVTVSSRVPESAALKRRFRRVLAALGIAVIAVVSCGRAVPIAAVGNIAIQPATAAVVVQEQRVEVQGASLAAVVPAVATPAPVPTTAPTVVPKPAVTAAFAPIPVEAAIGQPTIATDAIIIPDSALTKSQIPVIVAFHGAGGNGSRMAQRWVECANQKGAIVVAPSLVYRDYMDPEQVKLDDQENLPRVKALLDSLSERLGLPLDNHFLLYGFSRGGQMAHRFALFYPEEAGGVATLSSGNYTVPRKAQATAAEQPLLFPYGVSDLQKYAGKAFNSGLFASIPFWVGVGGADIVREQVPRNWDFLLGTNRVERAQKFAESLRAAGATVSFASFPGVGHEETDETRARVCDFLAQQVSNAS
jgi:predicted esterase